jgi:hypothetical protein
MCSATPLIFRANATQRAIAFILVIGCLLVGGRGTMLVVQNIPRIWFQLKLAQSQGEPSTIVWLSLALACIALIFAGLSVLLSIVALALIEGTHVILDEFGITVECTLLPKPIARRLGAGRILWKNIEKIERRMLRFVLLGQASPEQPKSKEIIGFLLVDELEKLILTIFERSPNLKLNLH